MSRALLAVLTALAATVLAALVLALLVLEVLLACLGVVAAVAVLR